jgi:hypothetical protein
MPTVWLHIFGGSSHIDSYEQCLLRVVAWEVVPSPTYLGELLEAFKSV